MANERVSQLNELLASELSTNDLFLITDMSLKESKKLELSQLILFIQASGSFNAIHAYNSDSASYVPGSGVDGPVISASYADWSHSGSHALAADSVVSASYSLKATSASWAPATSIPDTSSYSLRSGYADYAGVAYFLFYNGQPNGTASWAVSSSWAQNTGHVTQADTASYLQYSGFPNGTASYALNAKSSSFADASSTASFALSYPSTTQFVKAFAQVTWSVGVALPQITLQSNIGSFTYLNQFTNAGQPASYVAPSTWSQFSVVFAVPLSNANYIVMGDGYQPYALMERAGIIVHPIYSYKTIYGFTMSINTPSTSDFYTRTAGTYPNNEYGYITFQVLGL